MAINTQQAIQALALDVLDDLADEDEYLPFGGAILVDPLASDDSSDPEFARPMSVRVDDNTAWWQCPTTESTRRPIWPRV
jgi:hypothetical protein